MGRYNISLPCSMLAPCVPSHSVQQGNPPRRYKQGFRKSKDNFNPRDLWTDIRCYSKCKELYFTGMIRTFISEQVFTTLYTNDNKTITNHHYSFCVEGDSDLTNKSSFRQLKILRLFHYQKTVNARTGYRVSRNAVLNYPSL